MVVTGDVRAFWFISIIDLVFIYTFMWKKERLAGHDWLHDLHAGCIESPIAVTFLFLKVILIMQKLTNLVDPVVILNRDGWFSFFSFFSYHIFTGPIWYNQNRQFLSITPKMIWDVASFCVSNLVSVGKGGMNLNAEGKRRMAWLNYLVPLVIWHCEFIQQIGFGIISS